MNNNKQQLSATIAQKELKKEQYKKDESGKFTLDIYPMPPCITFKHLSSSQIKGEESRMCTWEIDEASSLYIGQSNTYQTLIGFVCSSSHFRNFS